MSEKNEITLEQAGKGVPIYCQQCTGVVRNARRADAPACSCDEPTLNEARTVLDAMLSASRHGRTVTG